MNPALNLLVPYPHLLGLCLVVWICLIVMDAPLRNDDAPFGIVSLELAGTGRAAKRALDSWSSTPPQQAMAAASLGLDYLFLVLYPLVLSRACHYYVHLARGNSNSNSSKRVSGLDDSLRDNLRSISSQQSLGLALSHVQLLAAPLDALENAALLMQVLFGTNLDAWARLAWWCAVPKFVIIASGLLYIATRSVVSMMHQTIPAAPETRMEDDKRH